MITDHERFSNIASGAQSIVLAIALIIGGIWTAFTFGALGTVQRARAEAAKLAADIHAKPSIQIDVSGTSIVDTRDGLPDLIVEVSIKNTGSLYMSLHFRTAICQPPE